MTAPDIIYLQCEEDDLPYNWEDTTWCSDKIHEFDVKYVRADSLTMAAPELLEALRSIMYGAEEWINMNLNDSVGDKARAAIAKAEGKS